MGRPKGSKNKHRAPVRRAQYQLRLSLVERGASEAAALLRGLKWSDWVRRVIRLASGLPEEDPREKPAEKGSDQENDMG